MSIETELTEKAVTWSFRAIGKKLGSTLMSTLLKSPINFFAKWGLSELFGLGAGQQFQQVLSKLDELEQEIENAVGKISEVVEESGLEDAHAAIEVIYQNLRSTLKYASDLETGFQQTYETYFNGKSTEIIDTIAENAERITDRLLGNGAEQDSKDYLSLVTTNLYNDRATIEIFYNRISHICQLYQSDLYHAYLVLLCLLRHDTRSVIQNRLNDQIIALDELSSQIANLVTKKLRDAHELIHVLGDDSINLRFTNHQTGSSLACVARSSDQGAHIDFQLIPKGDEYFYLKISDKKIGIDHYYGKSIKAVNSADSGHQNHLWKFVPRSSNPTRFFRLVNKATGQALDHYFGKSLKTAPVDEHPNHLWKVLPAKNGQFINIVNVATNGILGYSSDEGIHAFQGELGIEVSSINNQNNCPSGQLASCWMLHDMGNNVYNLVNSFTNQCLDHYDGESFRFVNTPSGHPNHLWRLVPTVIDDEHIYYYIRNQATGVTLDHYFGKSLAGAGDNNPFAPNSNHIWMINEI